MDRSLRTITNNATLLTRSWLAGATNTRAYRMSRANRKLAVLLLLSALTLVATSSHADAQTTGNIGGRSPFAFSLTSQTEYCQVNNCVQNSLSGAPIPNLSSLPPSGYVASNVSATTFRGPRRILTGQTA